MKSFILIPIMGTLVASVGQAETHPAPPTRDSVTNERLAGLYREASRDDPMRKQAPAKGPDPSVVSRPKSLIDESDMICFNGSVTLVPKRAVLQIPNNLAARLKYQPGAKFLGWAEFHGLNRGWITTVEVSRTQAEGNSPLSAEAKRQMVKSGNLVIATFQGGPISVLPLKVPVEKAATTSTPRP